MRNTNSLLKFDIFQSQFSNTKDFLFFYLLHRKKKQKQSFTLTTYKIIQAHTLNSLKLRTRAQRNLKNPESSAILRIMYLDFQGLSLRAQTARVRETRFFRFLRGIVTRGPHFQFILRFLISTVAIFDKQNGLYDQDLYLSLRIRNPIIKSSEPSKHRSSQSPAPFLLCRRYRMNLIQEYN